MVIQFTHFMVYIVQEKNGVEMKGTSSLINTEINGGLPKTLKEETRRYSSSREAISSKYAAVRRQSEQASKFKPEEKNIESSKVSLLDHGAGVSSSGLASTWQTMKMGFRSFKANIGARGFLPTRQTLEGKISRVSSSESLDDIFQRLKQPSLDQVIYNDEDYLEANISGPSR